MVKAAKKEAAKKEKKGPVEIPRSPRQTRLPEMEDPKIQALEDKAMDYADVRDKRIQLSQKEGELKKEIMNLMKAQKRERYKRGNFLIEIVHEQENVKVKVNSSIDEDE